MLKPLDNLLWVSLFISISASTEIINQNITGNTINCTQNDDCILMCDANNGANCAFASMVCQNVDSGICRLTCIGENSCNGLSFTAINANSVEIICGNGNGICICVFIGSFMDLTMTEQYIF